MVARVKSTRFGCMLAASFVVLLLAGCADLSESGSSQMEQPSKNGPPTETGDSRAAGGGPADCKPTQPDMLGPFYEPGAPVRTSVGSGYALSGTVLGAEECKPIPKARIEFWLANPGGEYDDAHRVSASRPEHALLLRLPPASNAPSDTRRRSPLTLVDRAPKA
jgi:hypothetical protein